MKARRFLLLISAPLSFTLGCGTGPTEPPPENSGGAITPSTRVFPTPRPTHPSFPTPCVGDCATSSSANLSVTPIAQSARSSERAIERLFPASAIVFGTAPAEENLEPSSGEASRSVRADVDWAMTLALKKLEKPNCRLIFADFVDSEGRTLQQNLDERGQTSSDVLRRLRFRDGTGERPCGYEGVLAFTTPGGRVISICGPNFRSALRGHPALAANILLHEELHRLGLEESPRFERASNRGESARSRPPTSLEITDRVAARCGS